MINHNTYRLKTYEFRHICLKHGKQRDKVNKNIDPKHRIISNMKEYVGIKNIGYLGFKNRWMILGLILVFLCCLTQHLKEMTYARINCQSEGIKLFH